MAFLVVTANEINQYIGKPGVAVIDLRDEELFEQEHISGAINIPYESFEEKKNMLSKYRVLILYCERGNTSLLTAKEYDNKSQLVLTLADGFNHNKKKFLIDGRR